MARAVGIDFKFTGDSTKAVAAFRQVAAAAKASGGDIGAAGRQIESALNKAEAAAAKQQQSLRAALGGGTQSKGAQFLQGLTDSLGLGEFTDQFGGVEGILENVSTKTALAATGVGLVTAATVKLGVTSAKTYLAIVGQVDAVADDRCDGEGSVGARWGVQRARGGNQRWRVGDGEACEGGRNERGRAPQVRDRGRPEC